MTTIIPVGDVVGPLHVRCVAQQAVCQRRVWRRLHGGSPAAGALAAKPDREVGTAAKLRDSADLTRGRLERLRGPRGATLADAACGRPATWVRLAGEVKALGEPVRLYGALRLVEPCGGEGDVALCGYSAKAGRQTWLELELYGLLAEQAGATVAELAVVHGRERKTQAYDEASRGAALQAVERIVELERRAVEPHVPIGSWCRRCEHRADCQRLAEDARDVSLVSGLSAVTWRAMRAHDIHTVDDLTDADISAIADLPHDERKRVGAGRAQTLIDRAQARATQRPHGRRDQVTLADRLERMTAVMFDVETDHYETVVLWGLHSTGEPRPRIVEAPLSRDGERAGWREFLTAVEHLRSQHGELCFLHWGHYDRSALERCAGEYGADQTARYVHLRLVDLYAHLRGAALPLKSYSQKSVEALTGFERRLAGREGLWAVNRLTEARMSQDRQAIDEVVLYLSEDLAGLRHIADWALGEQL